MQEDDFGGWPPVDELPLKYMTEEHKKALVTHCSDRANVDMPIFDPAFAPSSASPQQSDSSLPNSHHTATAAAVTPMPGQSFSMTTTNIMETAQQLADVVGCGGGGGFKITPAERPKTKPNVKPSKKDMETHAKWQKEAEAMGGKDARIVVSKPKAKTLIFELLRDEFAPMNITTINSVRVLKTKDARLLIYLKLHFPFSSTILFAPLSLITETQSCGSSASIAGVPQ